VIDKVLQIHIMPWKYVIHIKWTPLPSKKTSLMILSTQHIRWEHHLEDSVSTFV